VPFLHLAQANFQSCQILKNAHWTTLFPGGLSNFPDCFTVFIVISMGKIEAGHIHTRPD